MTFDTMSIEVTCVTLPKDHCAQVPWESINVCRYSRQFCKIPHTYYILYITTYTRYILERLCRAGPRGRARGRTTLGVHPLSWLLSNNRLEKVPFVSVPHTSSNQLLLSNQDKGCTPSVAHSLALPLGPAVHNVWTTYRMSDHIPYCL